eukprot:jgi/Chrzof1/10183/Cz04g31290.t1
MDAEDKLQNAAATLAIRALGEQLQFPIVVGFFQGWYHVQRYLDFDDEPPDPTVLDATNLTSSQKGMLFKLSAETLHVCQTWPARPEAKDLIPVVIQVMQQSSSPDNQFVARMYIFPKKGLKEAVNQRRQRLQQLEDRLDAVCPGVRQRSVVWY